MRPRRVLTHPTRTLLQRIQPLLRQFRHRLLAEGGPQRALRGFFEVDRRYVAVAALKAGDEVTRVVAVQLSEEEEPPETSASIPIGGEPVGGTAERKRSA